MDVSPHTVLVTVRDEYDAVDEPVGPKQIATAVGTTSKQIRPILESFCRNEFLVKTADGYRPTVTAREFLELDVELSDVAVVEIIED
ncbi:hypothetical protein ACOZ4F_01300 (plasmid) [Haloarcula marismortui]|uniref:hypothetical protein n=1 Tax=Haloarcula marismortui TaxID=2238 RepID=UPI000678EFA9